MFIKDLKDCPEFIAGDFTVLRELLNPEKQKGLALKYSLAHATLKSGESSTPHTLTVSEVYFILEGTGAMHIDNETSEVFPGQAIYIPPKAKQFIRNTGKKELKFLCIVDPAWKPEYEV